MEGGRKVRWEVDRDGSWRGKREKGERMGEGEPVFFLVGDVGRKRRKSAVLGGRWEFSPEDKSDVEES